MPDPIGHALQDFYDRISPGRLWVHNNYGPREEMPIAIYFREYSEMPELEQLALQLCRGHVLDAGAGAGSHVLWLQEEGLTVTAVELSAGACHVMRKRGVQTVVNSDILEFRGTRFDTVLLLMNGIGLTQTIGGLRNFLLRAKDLLLPGGQLLFDSSDVAYLYKGGLPRPAHYYGEVQCRYEYKKEKSPWFTWLYVDSKTLGELAQESGWRMEHLYEDEHAQFLARLTILS